MPTIDQIASTPGFNAGSVDVQPSNTKVTKITKKVDNLQPGVTYTILVRAKKNGQFSDYASYQYTVPETDKSGNNFTVSNSNTDIQLLGGGFAASSTSNPFPINIGKIDITQNTIAGSGTGVIMNQYGIAGFAAGTKKFSLSAATGDAYFAGRMEAGDIYIPNSTSPIFYVNSSGFLYAANANITGAITATSGSFSGSITAGSGSIANFTINTNTLTNTNSTTTIGIYNASQALLGYSGGIKIQNTASGQTTSYLVEYGLVVTPSSHPTDYSYAGRYSNNSWYIHESSDGYNSGSGPELVGSVSKNSTANYTSSVLLNNSAGIVMYKNSTGTYLNLEGHRSSANNSWGVKNIITQETSFTTPSGTTYDGDIVLVY